MTSIYKRLDQINPDLFRSLILGSDDSQPEQGQAGIMAPRPRPEGLGIRDIDTTPALEDTLLAEVARGMGRSAIDRERVANAVVPAMPVDPTAEMANPWFSLVPIADFLTRDKTEEAIPTLASSRNATPPLQMPLTGVDFTAGAQPIEEQPESDLSVAEDLYSPVAPEYRQSQVVDYSYYNQPLQEEGLRGRSRRGGDASEEVQKASMEAIIRAGKEAGMSNEDIALTLAIARHESGFNPDAAAGTTSAHGLGQFVNRTGEAYGLTDENRWDVNAQARALVEHTRDNIRLAESRGQGREYVYAYHHDGPSLAYGGLDIGRQNVMPRVDSYLELVNQYNEE